MRSSRGGAGTPTDRPRRRAGCAWSRCDYPPGCRARRGGCRRPPVPRRRVRDPVSLTRRRPAARLGSDRGTGREVRHAGGGGARRQRPAEARRADDRREPARERADRLPGARSRAREHELVISHGNGPQVGLLSLQASAYDEESMYPFDVLGAQTEGMIGYLIEQELGNLLPFEKPLATDPHDDRGRPGRPGDDGPDEVRRTGLHRGGGRRGWPRSKGWTVKQDGDALAPGRALAAAAADLRDPADQVAARQGRVVVCTGGGGIPTMYLDEGTRRRPRHPPWSGSRP